MDTRTNQPTCSICVANFNGEHLLDDCLQSVFNQLGGLDVEVIVHDDASSDGSLLLLEEKYPHVRVIASGENVGFCTANNRMAAAARGDYLLLLNNDAALDVDALQTLLTGAAQVGGDAILTLPQRDWETGDEVDRGCLLDLFHNSVPNRDPQRADVAYVVGACLWIPRVLWHELGGFPEWFGSLAEDAYLCCGARLRGVPVRCLAGSGYRHRQGVSFGGNRINGGKLQTTFRRRYLSERNKVAVLVVCMPTVLAWGLLVLHATLLVIEGVLLSLLRMDSRIFLKIYIPVLSYACRAPLTLRQVRREMQGKRCISLYGYLRPFVCVPQKLMLLWRTGIPEVR